MELWLVRHGETTWNEARRFLVPNDLNDTHHLDGGGAPGSPP